MNGDAASEGMLNDIGVNAHLGRRVPLVESVFDYGSRRGAWRVLDVFRDFAIPNSVLGVAQALQLNPTLAKACVDRGHEIVSYGYRWIDYGAIPEAVEREHIRRAIDILADVTGERPVGWMTGRPGPNTRKLLVAEGGILYDRDSLADELPYWLEVQGKMHLVIPYSYEANDNRFNENSGFSTALDFSTYIKDAFDVLYDEGVNGAQTPVYRPSLQAYRPARSNKRAHSKSRAYDKSKGVWFCCGLDVADHWQKHHSPPDRVNAYSMLI